MSRPVVIATRRLPGPVEARLRELFDARLSVDEAPLTVAALRDALAQADGILATVTDRFDAKAFATPGRRARVVANFGVGHEHIDLGAARAAGVVVTNTPGVLTDATADLAMALILAAARRLGEGERLVRSGGWTGWNPTQMLGASVSGSTLGIVGMGRIGQALARRAHLGFGMSVRYVSRSPVTPEIPAVQCSTLRELLQTSDIVSLHVPSSPETRHLIDADALGAMPAHAILVNTARGDIVDTTALISALTLRQIAGAGLDVYEGEPDVPRELAELENVVLLPHLGSATIAARAAMGMCAIDNLVAFFAGQECPNRIA